MQRSCHGESLYWLSGHRRSTVRGMPLDAGVGRTIRAYGRIDLVLRDVAPRSPVGDSQQALGDWC